MRHLVCTLLAVHVDRARTSPQRQSHTGESFGCATPFYNTSSGTMTILRKAPDCADIFKLTASILLSFVLIPGPFSVRAVGNTVCPRAMGPSDVWGATCIRTLQTLEEICYV